jgi:hypothetical protein
MEVRWWPELVRGSTSEGRTVGQRFGGRCRRNAGEGIARPGQQEAREALACA